MYKAARRGADDASPGLTITNNEDVGNGYRKYEQRFRPDLEPGGDFKLGREAAHSRRRIVHAHGDQTGAEVARALIDRVSDLHLSVACIYFGLELALQLSGWVERIPKLARLLFRLFPTARLCAYQFVLAPAVNVQPLHAIAPGPIRPVSLYTSAFVARVDFYGLDRLAHKTQRWTSLEDGVQQAGGFALKHSEILPRRILRNLAPPSNPHKKRDFRGREALEWQSFLTLFLHIVSLLGS